MRSCFSILILLLVCQVIHAEPPAWIWRDQTVRPSPAGERGFLRKTFSVVGKVEKATLKLACAGASEIKLNGTSVGQSPEIRQIIEKDVTSMVQGGNHVITVFGRTTADLKGMVFQLDLQQEYGKRQIIQSDASWRFSLDNPAGWDKREFDDSKWETVKVLGELGAAPWGKVFDAKGPQATPVSEITVAKGFRVELLRSAGEREGTWVCMTVDNQGRLYISPQNAIPESGFSKDSKWGGIWRATLDAKGQVAQWDKVPVPIGGCMGMLWAFDSLYLSGQGPDGQAIYRCKDSDGDGNVDSWKLFKKVPGGGGEHGAHAMVLGADNLIYIIMGNSTPVVEGIDPQSPSQNMAEDDLLPRIKDPVATFFDNVKSPYGYVVTTDAEGSKWSLWCTGMRNAYDHDFNEHGQLFTYDSDMEWDVGLPWYRPTRILHLLPGREYGFREGSAKLPDYMPDTDPPFVNVGLGSPTGVKFGTKAAFPDKYRRAFYALDWTYGRILAIHAEAPHVEEFLKGPGMPLADVEIGKDGAMYVIVGGRGTQSGLYRITAESAPAMESAAAAKPFVVAERQLREEMKPLLDPWIKGNAPKEGTILAASQHFVQSIDANQPLKAVAALRVMELALSRDRESVTKQAPHLRTLLAKYYPAGDFRINRELSLLLASLGEPTMVAPTLKLMESAQAAWLAANKPLPDPMKLGPQEEQIWFARILCEVPAEHFTAEQRTAYFTWFDTVVPQLKGGNNFSKFIEAIRQRALAKLPAKDREPVEMTHQLAMAQIAKLQGDAAATGPLRQFVKAYTLAELEPELGRIKAGRNFKRGEEIYTSMLCARCHLMNGAGGNVGPDLTSVGARFSPRDILDAIIDPSKVISEQYAAALVETKTTSLLGLIAAETTDELTLYSDPFGLSKQTVKKNQITKREAAKISLMPAGLINSLTVDEILDLLAYLQSGAKKDAANFAPTP